MAPPLKLPLLAGLGQLQPRDKNKDKPCTPPYRVSLIALVALFSSLPAMQVWAIEEIEHLVVLESVYLQ